MSKTDTAIERLKGALSSFDLAKKAHAETTNDLTEAKKYVETCARAVVDAHEGMDQPGLFDEEQPARTVRMEVDGREAAVRVPGADDEQREAPADIETVISGATGAPVDGASYPIVEDGSNEGFCICGYATGEPSGVNHDRRHAQFLAGVEGGDSVAPASGDVTKAVVKRQNAKNRAAAPKPARGRSARA